MSALRRGEYVSLAGTVRSPRSGRTERGSVYVRAWLELPDGSRVRCIWWDGRLAPDEGSAVVVEGEVRSYAGELEVHVRATRVEQASGPEAPEHRILRYYIACIEAEQARQLEFPASGREAADAFILDEGREPFVTAQEPVLEVRSGKLWEWLRRRLLGGRAEALYAGYPLVVGERLQDGNPQRRFSPLFFAPLDAKQLPDGLVQVTAQYGRPELNVFALELLGLSREERMSLVRALEDLPEFEEATSPVEYIQLWVELLEQEQLLPGGTELDPSSLRPLKEGGVSNTAALYVAARDRTVRALLEDLEELCMRPAAELRRGPLGVLFGAVAPPPPPPPAPQPSVVRTNLAQDGAVTAALSSPFTVVTGPPGTGKSQVLVNAVAAAVIQGERVLFASKNNKAVDVVFERLAEVSSEAVPIRAGATERRPEMARAILNGLSRTYSRAAVGSALGKWRRLQAELEPIYDAARRRVEAEERLRELETEYERILRDVPAEALYIEQPTAVRQYARRVLSLWKVASRPQPFWPCGRARWRRARDELAGAWEELRQLAPGLSLSPAPTPEEAQRLLELVEPAQRVLAARQAVERAKAELQELPDRWEIHDRLLERMDERVRISRRLFDATWRRLVNEAAPTARSAATRFAEGVQRAAEQGRGIRDLLGLVPQVLNVFPVWGLTNLSARTNLPLERELFDLVIIDEASQCDVASAIPLLYRARRALIIGDPRQLIHVTSLGNAAERRIADRFGLTEEERLAYSYKDRSLFGLASSRIGDTPLFLDQHYRSHPSIITFSNDHFYGSRLLIFTETSADGEGPAVRWVDVRGRFRPGPRGRSAENPPEAEAVVAELRRLAEDAEWGRFTVGVVTPYRAHAELIRALAARALPTYSGDLIVDTAHRFQGDERDIIIFSPVVSEQIPPIQANFAGDPNLVNVAVTRARRQLIVVGDRSACMAVGGVLGELARYVRDLEEGGFRSPLERRLWEALRAAGLQVEVGLEVEGYRLDLAVVTPERKLDVECDGAAFHRDVRADFIRDERLKAAGWEVLRFSGREIQRDLEGCVARVLAALEHERSSLAAEAQE